MVAGATPVERLGSTDEGDAVTPAVRQDASTRALEAAKPDRADGGASTA